MLNREMVGERGNRALRAHHPPQEPPPGAIHLVITPHAIRRRTAIRIVRHNRNAPRDLIASAVITRAAGGDEIPETRRTVNIGGKRPGSGERIGDRAAGDTHDARQPMGGGLSRGCHSTDQ